MSLVAGKLPPDTLEKLVLPRQGSRDPSVIVGPAVGEDAAVIDLGGDKLLVVHGDPITAAGELAGWLSVNIASNDIAVRGARPRWLVSIILLAEGAGIEELDKITRQMDEAARKLGAMIVGGHTEVAPGLESNIIAVTAFGVVEKDKLVTTSGANPGDILLMTKTAGLEGTAILATDLEDKLLALGLEKTLLEKARSYYSMVSVVKEALLLAENKLATSMHDPTEGGVLGGAAEIARASRKTIIVYEDKIPVAPETIAICRKLKADPLRLISSGVLLATIPRHLAQEALKLLKKNGVKATIIGEVAESENPGLILVRKDGSKLELPTYIPDEIYRLISGEQ